MILLISPSKTLDFSEADTEEYSQPRLLSRSEVLVDTLRKKSVEELQDLMDISEKLATLNARRYAEFETPFRPENAKPALLTFKGDVYTGLAAGSFEEKDLQFAQDHLRILSGLYGLLRPLDLMQPYRLEMGTRLKNGHGKNLYEFWDDEITGLLNRDLQALDVKEVVNLASKEYFNAVRPNRLNGELYHIHFKEKRKGTYRVISFYAKKARGLMCQYAIRNRLVRAEQLRGFDWDDYLYNEELSTPKEFVFTRG